MISLAQGHTYGYVLDIWISYLQVYGNAQWYYYSNNYVVAVSCIEFFIISQPWASSRVREIVKTDTHQ